jgi:transposase
MSLGPEFPSAVPEDTYKLAKIVFKKKKNLYVVMGDAISKLFNNRDFQDQYSRLGQHATNPVVMTAITLVQFSENLSDREVMDEIPGRIDLKYLLRLPLEHEGFDASDLVKFRKRLIEGSIDKVIFDRVLELAKENGLLKKARQRTDSTEVIAAVAFLSRIELIIEAMRNTLDCLSQLEPDFILWISNDFLMLKAYTERGMKFRIPKKENQQKELAEGVAKDAKYLLEEIDRDDRLLHLRNLRPVVILRRILGEQFDINERGQPRFKSQQDLAKSEYLLRSPFDIDARCATKRAESWLGYKLQVTETCNSRSPIITDVQVTKSTVNDADILPKIHRSLSLKDLAPIEHLVDSGYTGAEIIRNSEQKYKIKVIGPIQAGNSWQHAANKGFASSNFTIDWEQQVVTCPAGKQNQKWIALKDREAIHVTFSAKSCQPCPFKEDCTKSTNGGRVLELRTQALSEFEKRHKKETKTTSFWNKYRQRAGIEGTISRITDEFGMRRSRYMGLRKTEFQAKIAAAAMNLYRIGENLMRLAKHGTRISAFNRLLNLKAA